MLIGCIQSVLLYVATLQAEKRDERQTNTRFHGNASKEQITKMLAHNNCQRQPAVTINGIDERLHRNRNDSNLSKIQPDN